MPDSLYSPGWIRKDCGSQASVVLPNLSPDFVYEVVFARVAQANVSGYLYAQTSPNADGSSPDNTSHAFNWVVSGVDSALAAWPNAGAATSTSEYDNADTRVALFGTTSRYMTKVTGRLLFDAGLGTLEWTLGGVDTTGLAVKKSGYSELTSDTNRRSLIIGASAGIITGVLFYKAIL